MGRAIESFLKRKAESKLGLAGDCPNLGNPLIYFALTVKKFIYNICTQHPSRQKALVKKILFLCERTKNEISELLLKGAGNQSRQSLG